MRRSQTDESGILRASTQEQRGKGYASTVEARAHSRLSMYCFLRFSSSGAREHLGLEIGRSFMPVLVAGPSTQSIALDYGWHNIETGQAIVGAETMDPAFLPALANTTRARPWRLMNELYPRRIGTIR